MTCSFHVSSHRLIGKIWMIEIDSLHHQSKNNYSKKINHIDNHLSSKIQPKVHKSLENLSHQVKIKFISQPLNKKETWNQFHNNQFNNLLNNHKWLDSQSKWSQHNNNTYLLNNHWTTHIKINNLNISHNMLLNHSNNTKQSLNNRSKGHLLEHKLKVILCFKIRWLIRDLLSKVNTNHKTNLHLTLLVKHLPDIKERRIISLSDSNLIKW